MNKVTQDLICICKQKTFSPVSSINSSQTDKALPVKTSKPNFVTFFVYFGNSLFDFLGNVFVCYGSKSDQTGKPFCSYKLTRVWRRSLKGTGGESVILRIANRSARKTLYILIDIIIHSKFFSVIQRKIHHNQLLSTKFGRISRYVN